MKVLRKRSPDPGFMLAPMIDMTFLLLIFFMVTTKITKEQLKLEVALPTASNAVFPDNLADRDIINIDATGTYYVGDDAATVEQLTAHLKQRFKDYPPLRLYVRADKGTAARQVKELMRLAAEAGAVDVIFGSYSK